MDLIQLVPATAERFNARNTFEATRNLRDGVQHGFDANLTTASLCQTVGRR